MTDKEKLDVIIEHLTGVIDGGYPGDIIWIGDTLAYTSANTGEKHGSQLGVITRKEMLAWYNRAVAFLKQHEWPDDEINDALYETESTLPASDSL